MVTPGTAFQPDEIKLMRVVLDEASIILPKAERTSVMKAKLASRILAAVAKGERDPNRLRIAAVLEQSSSKDLTHLPASRSSRSDRPRVSQLQCSLA